MMRLLVTTAACLAITVPVYAAPRIAAGSQADGRIVVAQVSEGATGGRSGGPNQSQAIVKEGATGGRSGGPNQSASVVKEGTTGGRSGGPNQAKSMKKMHSKKKMMPK